MAVIHRTTLTPTKVELLAGWLPRQPWFRGSGPLAATPVKAGGFRLDDPAGEVGIEFMAASDVSGPEPVTYHVPFTYRAAPLDGAEAGLIGTTEHGVLGKRWVYDGTHDPVLVAQVLALLRGEAEPQAQSQSDTPDPTVLARRAGRAPEALALGAGAEIASVVSGPEGTDVLLTGGGEGTPGLVLRFHRVLAENESESVTPPVLGHVDAGWSAADGAGRRGRFAELRERA
ncbi:1,4-alpha-glucan branching protein [Streptomyces sp. NPDC049954]|uniref:maltokinase N-terminal cap-like domain-containing protein n=1 Tax=Streptomyces sp. NPDC049954 TaxID=3155779 RepID=UPI0034335996